jgi:fatty-acyl-CoA synthase
LLNHPERSKHNLSTLKNAVLGGASIPPDLLKKMIEELKIENICLGYGMTETSLCHSVTVKTDKYKSVKQAYESIGRPIPFTETKIVDLATGHIVALNIDGELLVRGPHIIPEYWDEVDKTNESIDKKGWLKTGDVCSMDKDGYIYFKSRNKDIIIRGGANLYPAEIESFLRNHPSISDVQVFGVPDERVGEEICAWIKLKANEKLKETELKAYCKGNISHFKVPRYVKFVDSFPINANNKVLKNVMREKAIKELNL